MKNLAAGLHAMLLWLLMGSTPAFAQAPTPVPPGGQAAPAPSGEMPITEYGIGAVAALIILGVVCFPDGRE